MSIKLAVKNTITNIYWQFAFSKLNIIFSRRIQDHATLKWCRQQRDTVEWIRKYICASGWNGMNCKGGTIQFLANKE